VMVWIYGGGFVAGSTSEPRQEGENLSKKGVVVVSCNYRLDVFGFFSHPELAKESGRDAAGNYGLMDQVAALQWVAGISRRSVVTRKTSPSSANRQVLSPSVDCGVPSCQGAVPPRHR